MLNRNGRTLEQYLEAGAYTRLLSDVGISKADDKLFRDFQQLGHEGTAVFYGTLSQEPDCELDKQMICMAEKKAMDLFDHDEK